MGDDQGQPETRQGRRDGLDPGAEQSDRERPRQPDARRRHRVNYEVQSDQDELRDERALTARLCHEQDGGQGGQRDEQPVRPRPCRRRSRQAHPGAHAECDADDCQDRADGDEHHAHPIDHVSLSGEGPKRREVHPEDLRLPHGEAQQERDRGGAPAHHPQEPDPTRTPARSWAAKQTEDAVRQDEREPDRCDLDREAGGPLEMVRGRPPAGAPSAQARPPDLPRPADNTSRQPGRQDQEAQVRQADLPASAAPPRSLRSHRAVHPHPLPGRLGFSSDKCNTEVGPVQVSGHGLGAFPPGSRQEGPLYNRSRGGGGRTADHRGFSRYRVKCGPGARLPCAPRMVRPSSYLRAARACGIPTGGWSPRCWLTEAVPAPWLAEWGLAECPEGETEAERYHRCCALRSDRPNRRTVHLAALCFGRIDRSIRRSHFAARCLSVRL